MYLLPIVRKAGGGGGEILKTGAYLNRYVSTPNVFLTFCNDAVKEAHGNSKLQKCPQVIHLKQQVHCYNSSSTIVHKTCTKIIHTRYSLFLKPTSL